MILPNFVATLIVVLSFVIVVAVWILHALADNDRQRRSDEYLRRLRRQLF